MAAAGANQEADALIEALGRRLSTGALGLSGYRGSGDSGCDRVRRAATVDLTLAGHLSAAVRVHAVDEAVWKRQAVTARG